VKEDARIHYVITNGGGQPGRSNPPPPGLVLRPPKASTGTSRTTSGVERDRPRTAAAMSRTGGSKPSRSTPTRTRSCPTELFPKSSGATSGSSGAPRFTDVEKSSPEGPRPICRGPRRKRFRREIEPLGTSPARKLASDRRGRHQLVRPRGWALRRLLHLAPPAIAGRLSPAQDSIGEGNVVAAKPSPGRLSSLCRARARPQAKSPDRPSSCWVQ
jgi:hypothetical protein